MTIGLFGLILLSVALGIGLYNCWVFGVKPPARFAPAVLAVIYYAVVIKYPPESVADYFIGQPTFFPEDARLLTQGLALLAVIVVLVIRLRRSMAANAHLRLELNNLKGEL